MSGNVSFLALAFIRFEIFLYIIFLLLQVSLYLLGFLPFRTNSNFFEVGIFFIFIGYLAQVDCTYIFQQKIEKTAKKDLMIRQVMFFLSSLLVSFGLSFFWYKLQIKILVIATPIVMRLIFYKKFNVLALKIFTNMEQKVAETEVKPFVREKIVLSILLYLNIVLDCLLYEFSINF